MQMKRHLGALKKLSDPEDNYGHASPSERVSCIWELTAELWFLTDSENAEQRLQRNIVSLTRQEG